ncbi:hypothetical protein [Arthrobacter sp. Soil762]|uniref:hypothetical protein n=1 Tax=Arthrobacter sp. Soil762 TaxID=1736401 RepID=UPI0006F4E5D6|nr:hypothetical protein [Arthrobacter sp. Soil762]KRE72747.1 hypothetical protein ASG77_08775 [Arthrobacter sp. Soil762]
MALSQAMGLFGNGRTLYEKEAAADWKTAKVLIAVKTAPVPSTAMGDTVCVAGIRLTHDGPEWIRLYPIPFRYLDNDMRFKKYQIVDVPVRPSAKDPRAESYNPDRDNIQIRDTLKPWKARHPHVLPLSDDWTMCRLYRTTVDKLPAPSLAAIKPKLVTDLKVTLHPGWTRRERAKLEMHLNQGTLFGTEPDKKILEPPRFRGTYSYRCFEADCKGHNQGMLDWEFTEFQRHHAADSDEVAIAAIRKRFFTEMCSPERGPILFVGNQAKRHHTFSVLGIYRSISST